MRNAAIIALAAWIAFSSPILAAPRTTQPPAASIAGTATTSTGETLANVTVQLRDLATGRISGSTTSNAAGGFVFAGIEAGRYTIELISATGQIVGTTGSISVAPGAAVAGVSVSASAAAVATGAAAGAAGGAAAASGVSTAVIVTSIAVAAGIAGAIVVAANGNASPSQ